MGFRRGDKVISARELATGLFADRYIPAGTPGVIVDVDGLLSIRYTVTFAIDRAFMSDAHETISRLDETDLKAR
ncbi:hypothetical protein ACFV9C_42605 [Kribbella sp. NPDC059898]|uniref:hypothetical protein n=1 Tax=Kribbella sp. NPDC059898 TaxID=3346995 RepID=UPI003646B4F3